MAVTIIESRFTGGLPEKVSLMGNPSWRYELLIAPIPEEIQIDIAIALLRTLKKLCDPEEGVHIFIRNEKTPHGS